MVSLPAELPGKCKSGSPNLSPSLAITEGSSFHQLSFVILLSSYAFPPCNVSFRRDQNTGLHFLPGSHASLLKLWSPAEIQQPCMRVLCRFHTPPGKFCICSPPSGSSGASCIAHEAFQFLKPEIGFQWAHPPQHPHRM